MDFKPKYVLTSLLIILAIALSACGASANTSTIGTAVALTVQAQNTQQAQFTPTPLAVTDAPPLLSPTVSDATLAPPTAPPTGAAGGNFCTASAAFVSETIPDGSIEQPGATFTKTWTIENTGTCPWDSTWQLIYFSGDMMGASGTYSLPQVAPGGTMNISIVLVAPTTDGQYTGYWKIKSPWGMVFGDNSGNPFWVQVVVGSGTPGKGTATAYGITSVTYDIAKRCTTANIFYTITATISSNGPLTIKYHWQHSDGYRSPDTTLDFPEATTKTVSEVWSQRQGSPATVNPRWDQIIVTDPFYQEFSKTTFTFNCY